MDVKQKILGPIARIILPPKNNFHLKLNKRQNTSLTQRKATKKAAGIINDNFF